MGAAALDGRLPGSAALLRGRLPPPTAPPLAVRRRAGLSREFLRLLPSGLGSGRLDGGFSGGGRLGHQAPRHEPARSSRRPGRLQKCPAAKENTTQAAPTRESAFASLLAEELSGNGHEGGRRAPAAPQAAFKPPQQRRLPGTPLPLRAHWRGWGRAPGGAGWRRRVARARGWCGGWWKRPCDFPILRRCLLRLGPIPSFWRQYATSGIGAFSA